MRTPTKLLAAIGVTVVAFAVGAGIAAIGAPVTPVVKFIAKGMWPGDIPELISGLMAQPEAPEALEAPAPAKFEGAPGEGGAWAPEEAVTVP